MACQTHGGQTGVSQRREVLWSGAGPHSAVVFAQSHIANPVQLVLDFPMLSIECQQALSVGTIRGKTGDGVRDFRRALTILNSCSLDSANLSQTGPIELFCQTSAGLKMALGDASMPLVERGVLTELRLAKTLAIGGKIPVGTRLRWLSSIRLDCLSRSIDSLHRYRQSADTDLADKKWRRR